MNSIIFVYMHLSLNIIIHYSLCFIVKKAFFHYQGFHLRNKNIYMYFYHHHDRYIKFNRNNNER